MDDLFTTETYKPLASLLRPTLRTDIVGQQALIGPEGPITKLIEKRATESFLLWGPPGTGKTSIARIVAKAMNRPCAFIDATSEGTTALRRIVDQARADARTGRSPTIVFIDEIARWNSSQQTSLLPIIEDGTIMMIGATTENPGFSINPALLSRVAVYTLTPLSRDELRDIASMISARLKIAPLADPQAMDILISAAHGDARVMIGLVAGCLRANGDTTITAETAASIAPSIRASLSTDRRYALLSALQKSIRASDPQAAVLYLAMLIRAGEPGEAIFRRLAIIASEDVGLADAGAAALTAACAEAFGRSGYPEGEIPLAHATLHLALAPKSASAHLALNRALAWVDANPDTQPPPRIVNAPTKLMQDLGYRAGYKYDHDFEEGLSFQDCLPETIDRRSKTEEMPFWKPSTNGDEAELAAQAAGIEKTRRALAQSDAEPEEHHDGQVDLSGDSHHA